MMKLSHRQFKIGLAKPFKVLHISDTHLTFIDERDDERKRHMARGRQTWAATAEAAFAEQLDYASKQHLPVLHTGDLIDFVSMLNLEKSRELLAQTDYFIAMGNHEVIQYMEEAEFYPDAIAHRQESLPLVESYFTNRLTCAARVINGVNFVALDNGWYQFTAVQLEFLQTEVAKGLPVVLMLHVPLYTEKFYQCSKNIRGAANVMGIPEEYFNCYASEFDKYEQGYDDITMLTIRYIYATPLIRAVLCGHIHKECEDILPSGIIQYAVSEGFSGAACKIEFC